MQETATTISLSTFFPQIRVAASSVLLLDYDGTLAPFHVDRSLACPYPGVVGLLERIMLSGRTRIIILSGRPIVELRALLTPMNEFEMWGAHGLERQASDGSYSRMEVSERNADALAEAERWVSTAGLLSTTEIKPGGIAVHWRGMSPAQAKSVKAIATQGWAALARRSGLKLLEFEAGLELRVTHPDKGDAVAAVLADLDPHIPVACLGDDITDEDGFRVLGERGLSVLVKEHYRETFAQAWIKPPAGLIDFLEQWLSQVS